MKNEVIFWSEKYSVSDERMDKQHQWLFEIFNQIQNLDIKKESHILNLIVDELVDYTEVHFREEEKIMEDLNIPGLAHHKNLHDNFRKMVINFKNQLNREKPDELMSSLLGEIRTWFTNHILIEDKKYQVLILENIKKK